jgi:DNA-binding beta-propeller fold protein YncE
MRIAIWVCSSIVLLQISSAARADKLVLVAGGGTGGDGPALEAALKGPFGVDFDKFGNMYIAEFTGNRLLKVDPRGTLSTVAGTGEKGNGGDGGPGLKAQFNSMHSLAVGRDGAVYLADTFNNRIRKFDPKTGSITAFAGTGKPGFSGDGGPALEAQFGGVYSIAFNAAGDKLYADDLDNRRIRVIDMSTGIVTTVAGNGKRGVPKDGSDAKDAPLVGPRAVAVDGKGNIYILERSGHCLRVVASDGKIRTVAGTGKRGLSGDGGDAREATMNGPKHLCIDRGGNVIIADTANHVIRKYLPREGKIVRIAGTGKKGKSGDGGDALTTPLDEPHGVFVRDFGELYIVDSFNDRIFKVVRGSR